MRILIIEDQPEILQNITDFLELKGYFVDCAYDGLGGMHLAVTQSFDLIILDPPKFAPTRKQVKRAARGYKDINLLAMKLLRPGGVLFTVSCSGGVDRGLFQKIVAGAAEDTAIDIQIVEHLSQASDHPVLLSFPEGAYLKGLVCRRI